MNAMIYKKKIVSILYKGITITYVTFQGCFLSIFMSWTYIAFFVCKIQIVVVWE